MIHNTTIDRLRRKFGSSDSNLIDYVALYLRGVKSVWNFKWSIIDIAISFILSSIALYLNNQLILDETAISLTFIITFIISSAVKHINTYICSYFQYKIEYEQLIITKNIREYVHNLFINASYKWKSKYISSDQIEALDTNIDRLSIMFTSLFRIIDKLTQFCSIIAISVSISYHLTISVIIYMLIILIEYKYVAPKKLAQTDSSIYRNKISNQLTNQVDIDYSIAISNILKHDLYNPTIGIHDLNVFWINRSRLANLQNISKLCSAFISSFIISIYLYYIGIPKFIMFFIMNQQIFVEILSMRYFIQQLTNNEYLTKLITMLDDIELYKPLEIYKYNPCELFLTNNFVININGLSYQITDDILIEYTNNIQINSDDRIILLNGEKGSGKSVTVDILGGRYDNTISNGMTYNMQTLSNEFRDLREHVFYMRQCVMEDYRNNEINNIIMPLCELFPGGTLHTISEYLFDFKIDHKMPETLEEPLCKTERGLSPGEMQSFLFASQFWKAKLLQPRIMIMDEPERNIDQSVMYKALKTIIDDFHGVIILITHSSDVKRYIMPNVTQLWNYRDIQCNNKRILTFDIVKNQIQMLELI